MFHYYLAKVYNKGGWCLSRMARLSIDIGQYKIAAICLDLSDFLANQSDIQLARCNKDAG